MLDIRSKTLKECQQKRDSLQIQRDELLKVLAPVQRAYHEAWQGAMDEYDFDAPLFLVRLSTQVLEDLVYCYEEIKESVDKGT